MAAILAPDLTDAEQIKIAIVILDLAAAEQHGYLATRNGGAPIPFHARRTDGHGARPAGFCERVTPRNPERSLFLSKIKRIQPEPAQIRSHRVTSAMSPRKHPGLTQPDALTVWARILRRTRHDPSGCWLWTGAVTSGGYGCIRVGPGHLELVHRVAVLARAGPIPDGLTVDHGCHDSYTCRPLTPRHCPHRLCVNPAHLSTMTRADNTRRRTSAASAAAGTCSSRGETAAAVGAPPAGPGMPPAGANRPPIGPPSSSRRRAGPGRRAGAVFRGPNCDV